MNNEIKVSLQHQPSAVGDTPYFVARLEGTIALQLSIMKPVLIRVGDWVTEKTAKEISECYAVSVVPYKKGKE